MRFHTPILHAMLCLVSTMFLACVRPSVDTSGNQNDSTIVNNHFTANIFVENSGSMAGYCNISDTAAIETLIKDYYDRLNSCSDNIDSVSLNLINTTIESSQLRINDFLTSIKGRCTAQYTKLDEMLNLMMDNVSDSSVNIMISDYVFTSNNGNLAMASSDIASLFTRQLERKDFAVAIYKYMINFKGKYYPGGLNCNKPLPLYVWVFGNKDNVRSITRLPLSTSNCGTFFMQKPYDASFDLSVNKNARMINGKKINVKHWKKNRYEDYYEFSFDVKLSNVLLSKEQIKDRQKYVLNTNNSTKFLITEIIETGIDKYKFTLRTTDSKPAPGELNIIYPIQTPNWIENSNYIGNGIPNDSTTYGISYLINGVAKAFKDTSKNNSYFTINITFE